MHNTPIFTDHYATLGVPPNATTADIKSAFRKLAKLHHPDKKGPGNQDAAQFHKIRKAHDVLTKPMVRRVYNIKYKAHQKATAAKKTSRAKKTNRAKKPRGKTFPFYYYVLALGRRGSSDYKAAYFRSEAEFM